MFKKTKFSTIQTDLPKFNLLRNYKIENQQLHTHIASDKAKYNPTHSIFAITMAPPSTKFLSLIPTLHESAVIIDGPASESAPQSPTVSTIEQVEKSRRSSSSASEASMPGDAVTTTATQQFLKLGQ